ncbi:aminodeoxychorismate lyase [Neobacillus sp. Marseille-QA0830]
MKINLVSSFAAGIFIATGILGTVYWTGDSQVSKAASKSTQKVELSEEEMVNKLTAAGYTIQAKTENNPSPQAQTDQQAQAAAPAATDTNQPPTQVVVNVTEGMGSIDVGRVLRDGKLIDDAFQFSKDIEQRGLVNKLRSGTYTVDSSMSYDQIITTIYGN